ncbi:MAG TPA: polyhydroxyalkanoate synthesis regulator DNA-binding domain-containing protein [Myxococcota bacterium]|jgi:polyhydroxyalkanoate synthesis repressor PhaR
MAVLIKRYANRKLYNTATSRYITLRGISDLLESGNEVRVIDNETGEDMTAVTLSQILVETERGGRSAPGSLLSELFQRGGSAIVDRVRQGVDEAREDLDELRGNLRGLIGANGKEREPVSSAQAELERVLQKGFERMAQALDIPRRSELREISERLDRLTRLIEEREAREARAGEEPPPRRRAGER